MDLPPALTRRIVLIGAAGLASGLIAGRDAAAQALQPGAHLQVLNKLVGGKKATPGKIKLRIPEIAENGNTVPLTITVDSPMTRDDYVSDIMVVAEANPQARIMTFHLTPLSGRAEAATRIRLAATETVTVVAKTSKGQFISAQKPVKVTIGGCGG